MKRKILSLIIVLLIINSFGCTKKDFIRKKKITLKDENTILEANITVWTVYWDTDVDDKLEQYKDYIDSISYFSADFNENNNIVLRDKTKEQLNKYKSLGKKNILSIVNDKVLKDGHSIIKDTNLLKEIYSSDEKTNLHIKEIVEIAKENNFDIVEIDYEQLKNDLKLWESHLNFLENLYKELKDINVDLRVLLEPNVPIKKINVFEGPVYVMMCYNLHGPFSNPGEKSNKDFIKELITKMESVPGRKDFAIPTGGFQWNSEGEVCKVSEDEATLKLNEFNAEKIRDEDSGYIVGIYTDDKNIKNEIWYADEETLKILLEPILENKYDISIWRLD